MSTPIKQNLTEKSLPELRRMLKTINVGVDPKWTKEDCIKILGQRSKSNIVASVVDDMSVPIKPGFARIMVASNTTDGKDVPIFCVINDFKTTIPRGVVVDVPIEVVDGALKGCTKHRLVTKSDREGNDTTEITLAPAYPITEYGRTPSDYPVVRGSIPPERMSIRNQYRALFGRWPTHKAERDFLDAKQRRVTLEAIGQVEMSEDTALILGVDKPAKKSA